MNQETYVYTDVAGKPLFRVVRTGDKRFFQEAYRPDHPQANADGYIRGRDGIAPVLYRLHSIRKAIQAGERIFIVEGEKDVHTLEALGLVATTNPGGASPAKWTNAMTEALVGCTEAICIPDNDEPGRWHMDGVAAKLHNAGIPVRVVHLPELSEKGDVSDWLDGTRTVDGLLAVVEEAEPFAVSGEMASPSSGGRKRQARQILELMDAADVDLFHDGTRTP